MPTAGMWINTQTSHDFTSANPQLDMHVASLSLGIDVQLDFGLRFRSGATLRPLIYVRAREGDTAMPVAEDAVSSSWRIFGAEGALGWAW
jgi:hypothetical protein